MNEPDFDLLQLCLEGRLQVLRSVDKAGVGTRVNSRFRESQSSAFEDDEERGGGQSEYVECDEHISGPSALKRIGPLSKKSLFSQPLRVSECRKLNKTKRTLPSDIVATTTDQAR